MSKMIRNWGNGLGIRIPKEFADRLNLSERFQVEFHLEDGRLIVEPVRNGYNLDELVDGIIDENRNEE